MEPSNSVNHGISAGASFLPAGHTRTQHGEPGRSVRLVPTAPFDGAQDAAAVSKTMLLGISLRRALLLIGVLLAAFTAGCGNQVEKKVEKGIARSLPDIIGPARSYDVHVTGSSLAMVKGKLSTMHILGQDVHLPNGIILARLTVLSRDIAFDTGSRTLKHVQGTDFTAVLSEAELNRYLKKAYSSVPELKVELVPAIIRICARPTIAGLGPGIVAEAALKVRDRRLIMLDFDSIRVGGLGTPRPARDYVESKVNPVFDVSDIGYNASVGSVAIGKRQLSLSGSLDLMATNKKK